MIPNKRLLLRLFGVVLFFVLLSSWSVSHFWKSIRRSPEDVSKPLHPTTLPCSALPGADSTVVILRTGSTEIEARLPIHLKTTSRCYPHYLIFSDYGETFRGQDILDALETVSADTIANNPDFELYRRLRQDGRAALNSSELSEGESQMTSKTGNMENAGWKLDKWKFLPMIERTLREYPDKEWYVFAEADTFMFWSQLLAYLQQMDPLEPHYLGSKTVAGQDTFAHGGSGFIVSQPALRKVVEEYGAHKTKLETFTDGHWAGDAVLGKTFSDAGVEVRDAWPILQGEDPGRVPYVKAPPPDENTRVWCYPSVSYHHVSPDEVERLWNLEQFLLEGRKGFVGHASTTPSSSYTDMLHPRRISPAPYDTRTSSSCM